MRVLLDGRVVTSLDDDLDDYEVVPPSPGCLSQLGDVCICLGLVLLVVVAVLLAL